MKNIIFAYRHFKIITRNWIYQQHVDISWYDAFKKGTSLLLYSCLKWITQIYLWRNIIQLKVRDTLQNNCLGLVSGLKITKDKEDGRTLWKMTGTHDRWRQCVIRNWILDQEKDMNQTVATAWIRLALLISTESMLIS